MTAPELSDALRAELIALADATPTGRDMYGDAIDISDAMLEAGAIAYAAGRAAAIAGARDSQDAARYRWLRELDPKDAQAFFWNYTSRKQRDAAIDAAIDAARAAMKEGK